MSTKDRILAAVRREPLTVAQICERLGVTRNAVNVQIKHLEASGLARAAAMRQGDGAGKPAIVYEATVGSEDVASSAYRPFLLGLLSVVREKLSHDALTDVLEATGRRLAREAGLSNPPDFETGLRAAMAAADSLGAMTETALHENGIVVRNYSCPVASAVRGESRVCRAIAAFFSEATGRPAREMCVRQGRVICQYLIERN
jgi:predicted ArsR family transcriptional regulator